MSHKVFGHCTLCNARVWEFLKQVDAAGAQACRAAGCPRCGGALHSATYPREPHGLAADLRDDGSSDQAGELAAADASVRVLVDVTCRVHVAAGAAPDAASAEGGPALQPVRARRAGASRAGLTAAATAADLPTEHLADAAALAPPGAVRRALRKAPPTEWHRRTGR